MYEVLVDGNRCIGFKFNRVKRGFMIQIGICFALYTRKVGTVVLSHFNLVSRRLFSRICQNEQDFPYIQILSVGVASVYVKELIRNIRRKIYDTCLEEW